MPSELPAGAVCRKLCCACWRPSKSSEVVPDPVLPQAFGTGSPSAPSIAAGGSQAAFGPFRLHDPELKYPDGSSYKGQVLDGRRHGWGTLTLKDGTLYEAEWRSDKRHGEGVEKCPDGTRFTGHYIDGCRSGQGVMSWPEGSKYVGQFKHDRANGDGVLMRTDGSVYKGQFSEDAMSGAGRMKWTDGGEYEGQFVANKRDGFGKMSWASGRWKRYEGEWRDSLQNGRGKLMDGSDRVFEGQFSSGRLEKWLDHREEQKDESPKDIKAPSYWVNTTCDTSGFAERCDCSDLQRDLIQTTLDETFRSVRTRDRRGKLPHRLRLVKCHRVENSKMWMRYTSAKARVAARRQKAVTPIEKLGSGGNGSGNGRVKTHASLSDHMLSSLDPSVNEVFLWHGTTPEGALGISRSGFRTSLAGTRAGTYFGRGCYFSECSSKSDEYAREGDNLLAGVCAFLLCRVICGQIFRTAEPDAKAIEQALSSGEYDTVLGDREASVNTFREFVVYDEDCIYPEFVVLYERKYADTQPSS